MVLYDGFLQYFTTQPTLEQLDEIIKNISSIDNNKEYIIRKDYMDLAQCQLIVSALERKILIANTNHDESKNSDIGRSEIHLKFGDISVEGGNSSLDDDSSSIASDLTSTTNNSINSSSASASGSKLIRKRSIAARMFFKKDKYEGKYKENCIENSCNFLIIKYILIQTNKYVTVIIFRP